MSLLKPIAPNRPTSKWAREVVKVGRLRELRPRVRPRTPREALLDLRNLLRDDDLACAVFVRMTTE